MKKQVEFFSESTRCSGTFYLPEHPGRRPCVLLCTGFGGTQDTPSVVAVAEALAEAGFAAFAFDYRTFGASGGEVRQIVSIEGQIADILAALETVKVAEQVDAARLGLWGTSLGGGHVVTAAARSKDVKAVVAQIPFNGFPKKVEGRSLRQTMRLLGAMRRDRRNGKRGRPPFYIAAVGQQGELAVMTGKDAATAIEGMKSATWVNQVAPRGLFEMMKYKPSAFGPQVQQPVLVCYGVEDRETQVPQVLELIQSLPRGEEKAYPFSHFAFYRPDVRNRVIQDQIHFFQKHLHL